MSLSPTMTAGSITRPACINSPSTFRIVSLVTLHSLASAEMLGRMLLLRSLAFRYALPIVTFLRRKALFRCDRRGQGRLLKGHVSL